MLARHFDEAGVARMQIAHRRHDGYVLAVVAPLLELLTQLFLALDDDHEKQCSGFG